jgi:hypothetical protein
MQSIAVRLLIGAGMMILALAATGILAVGLEQRAEGLRPVDSSYTPPKLEPY